MINHKWILPLVAKTARVVLVAETVSITQQDEPVFHNFPVEDIFAIVLFADGFVKE